MSKKVPMIALTGGPCGGKSSSLDSLKSTLNDAGFDVFTVPEANTILVSNGATFPGFDEGKRSELLQYEINLLQLLFDMERAMQSVAAISAKKPVIICDRGAMDIRAYLPDDLWAQLLLHMGLTEKSLLDRYDLVLHLTTAARGAEAHYTTANNSSRTETAEEARLMDDKTLQAWSGHPRLRVALNTEGGFPAKLAFVAQQALTALAHCEPDLT